MALSASHLADKSALARITLPAVAARLRPLLEKGFVATCAIVDLEVLFSARSLDDYQALLQERRAFESARITPEVMSDAIDLQHRLARRGQHRVPIPDLVISAASRMAGLVVLHYDPNFERIAQVGGDEQSGSVDCDPQVDRARAAIFGGRPNVRWASPTPQGAENRSQGSGLEGRIEPVTDRTTSWTNASLSITTGLSTKGYRSLRPMLRVTPLSA